MSVKGQLRACTDFLMVGMRAAERESSEEGKKLIRACMDHVELLVRLSDNVKLHDVEATIPLLNKAAAEMYSDDLSPAVTSALRSAIERLHALRAELTPAKPTTTR